MGLMERNDYMIQVVSRSQSLVHDKYVIRASDKTTHAKIFNNNNKDDKSQVSSTLEPRKWHVLPLGGSTITLNPMTVHESPVYSL